MIARRIGGLLFFQFERLGRYPELIHAVSTRGAASARRSRGLNLSFAVADDPSEVVAAREEVCAALGLELDQLVVPRQVHGAQVIEVGRGERGRGARDRESGIAGTDGLTTAERGVALLIAAADCVPLLCYDPVRGAIGAAHAGWRGTVAKVAAATVGRMAERYGTRPGDLMVGIGPSIGPCCYHVGEEVIREARAAFGDVPELFAQLAGGRTCFNLWQANHHALIEAGVAAENVEWAALCTACHSDLFFSHRAESGEAGRFAAIIALRADRDGDA